MSKLLGHPSNLYRGYGRFVIKTIDGRLYCAGNNYRGDLGCNKPEHLTIPKFEQIVQDSQDDFYCDIISDGPFANHTMIVSNHPNNNLYAFGSNKRGMFGNYKSENYEQSNFS